MRKQVNFGVCLLCFVGYNFLPGIPAMSFSTPAFNRCCESLEGAGIAVGKATADVDPKNAAYDACWLDLGGNQCAYRTAKITPTKNGAFVTCWKRPGGKGPIVPFNPGDFCALVVAVEETGNFGFFFFPAEELLTQKILEEGGKKGKLSFRVYAPWVAAESKQAAATQAWQKPFFVQDAKDAGWLQKIFSETPAKKRLRVQ